MGRAAMYIYNQFGLPGAGLIFLLEGLGVPIPVEIPLGIIGLRMTQGQSTYWHMVLFMWSTTVVGNTVGYLLGYHGGRPVIFKLTSWFRIKPETWDRMENWFRRHGLKVVIFTRWINWGFAQNIWLCGVTRMSYSRFFAVMIINDFLWAMGWTWLTKWAMEYLHRRSFAFLHHSTFKIGALALAGILLAVGVWALLRSFRRKGGPQSPAGGSTDELPTQGKEAEKAGC